MQMGIVSLAHSYRVHGTEKEVDWEKVHLQIVGVEARPKAVKHINIFQSFRSKFDIQVYTRRI